MPTFLIDARAAGSDLMDDLAKPNTPEFLALREFEEKVRNRPGGINEELSITLMGAVWLADETPVDGYTEGPIEDRVVRYMEAHGYSRHAWPTKDMIEVLRGPLPTPEAVTVRVVDMVDENNVIDMNNIESRPVIDEYTVQPQRRGRGAQPQAPTVWDHLEDED